MLLLAYNATLDHPLPAALAPATVQRAVNHDAAYGLTLLLKEHFTALGGRGFWEQAAKHTQVLEEDAAHSVVGVQWRGVALQRYGGTITAAGNVSELTGKPTRALLIPSKRSPIYLRRRPLAELGIAKEKIHIIRSRNKKAYLVADTVKRVKLKPGEKNGRRKTKDKQTFIFLGSLRRSATIPPHPHVLPTEQEQTATVQHAVGQALRGLGFLTSNP